MSKTSGLSDILLPARVNRYPSFLKRIARSYIALFNRPVRYSAWGPRTLRIRLPQLLLKVLEGIQSLCKSPYPRRPQILRRAKVMSPCFLAPLGWMPLSEPLPGVPHPAFPFIPAGKIDRTLSFESPLSIASFFSIIRVIWIKSNFNTLTAMKSQGEPRRRVSG